MYHAIRGGTPTIPSEAASYIRDVFLAERTGWTLDYIRSMDIDDYLNVLQILDAKDTAEAHAQIRAAEAAAGKRH